MGVVCDWLTVISKISEGGGPSWLENMGLARLGKALRSLRILRMLRLMRLKKLGSLMVTVQDMVGAEWISIVVGIFKNVSLILFVNHVIACLWYWLGTQSVSGYSSWVDAHDFGIRPWGYQYWSALHWSVTQFTPGSMHVQPHNIMERVFAVAVLLFAMIVFSSFVSSVTNSMALLFGRNSQDSHQQWVLRKYLQQRSISRDLTIRVNRYISFMLEAKRNSIQHEDVLFLDLLSGPLLDELNFELHSDHLMVHPFLAELGRQMPAVLRKLCSIAVKNVSLSRGDALFSPGASCTEMYIVVSGLLSYKQEHQGDAHELLRNGNWCSEAVLWTPWYHRGRMRSKQDSQLVAIDSSKFREVLTREYQDMPFPKIYGGAFVKALNDALKREGPSGSVLSDVQEDALTYEAIKLTLASAQKQAPPSDVKSVELAPGEKDE